MFGHGGEWLNSMHLFTLGATYFALVFGTGFVLGTIRTLWLVPRLGIRTAELLEAPLMLVAIWVAGGWIARRVPDEEGTVTRVAVGLIAVAILLAAELLLGMALRGLSPREVFTNHDPVSGTVYFALLGLFAAMPWLAWKSR
jgi:hypothetical protein